jgi:DUF4097 and DUF4098 domain-containing protein YvlB
MKAIACMALCGVSLAAVAAERPDIRKVNGSITVAAANAVGNVSTVNGAIHADDKAVMARVRTVNGVIQVGSGDFAQSLNTVNGSIDIGSGSRIDGTVQTVNGAIHLGRLTDVSGRLTTVNGRISLDAARVGGDIETANGSIDVGADSRVGGGIFVHGRDSGFGDWISKWFGFGNRPPTVIIEPRAVVQGPLRFEHPVKLYVSDRARIGPVQGATAITFTGERPPQ